MQALFIQKFGGNEVIQIGEQPDPIPAANEILIEVCSVGINPVDWKICEGRLESVFTHEFPLVLGWDVAGKVGAVGSEVSDWKVGDEVYAFCRKPTVQHGTFAEKVVIPEEFAARKPESVSLVQAGALPLVVLTAWQALFDFAGVQEGSTVMIHGGAGGVGSFAVPLARWAGCTVYTSASAHNHDYLKERGAHDVVDYREESVADWMDRREPGGYDFIFDCVGGEALEMSYDRVRPAGSLITIAAPIDRKRCEARHVRCASMIVRPNGEQLREVGKLLDNGTLPLCDIAERPYQEVAAAFDENRGGHTRGKVVLRFQ